MTLPLIIKCTCGAVLEIETDDKDYAEKKAKKWQKKHEKCKQRKEKK